MTLDAYMDQMLPALENDLREEIEAHIPPELIELREMLAYHLGWEGENAGPEARGKRLRGLITLLSCAVAGGDWHKALPAAVAVELIHNFSLLHDDIQDKSELRRGRPAVWVLWGVPQAINAGDTLYTLAFMALARLETTASAQIALRANALLAHACLRLTQGQFLDLSYEQRPVIGLTDYWPMVEGKTSALIAACAELGAVCAEADETAQAAFQQFGQYLGLAFQVQDDYLGLWGNEALTGKSSDSDLATGKKTLPVLYGLSLAGPFAQRWASGPIPPAEVKRVAEMLAEEQAREYTLETSSRLTHLALEALSIAGRASQAAEALFELADRLLQRQS